MNNSSIYGELNSLHVSSLMRRSSLQIYIDVIMNDVHHIKTGFFFFSRPKQAALAESNLSLLQAIQAGGSPSMAGSPLLMPPTSSALSVSDAERLMMSVMELGRHEMVGGMAGSHKGIPSPLSLLTTSNGASVHTSHSDKQSIKQVRFLPVDHLNFIFSLFFFLFLTMQCALN